MSVSTGGAALFNFYGKFKLRPGGDLRIPLLLTYPVGHALAGQAVDLSGWTAPFVGAFRERQDEDLTTSPLAPYTAEFDAVNGNGTGTDGYIALIVAGSDITQDILSRGFHNLFGVSHGGQAAPVVVGRFEADGATVDPLLPAT